MKFSMRFRLLKPPVLIQIVRFQHCPHFISQFVSHWVKIAKQIIGENVCIRKHFIALTADVFEKKLILIYKYLIDFYGFGAVNTSISEAVNPMRYNLANDL